MQNGTKIAKNISHLLEVAKLIQTVVSMHKIVPYFTFADTKKYSIYSDIPSLNCENVNLVTPLLNVTPEG